MAAFMGSAVSAAGGAMAITGAQFAAAQLVGSAIAGAVSGAVIGAATGYAATGTLRGALEGARDGATTGALSGAVSGYYGSNWSGQRVAAESVAGGVSSELTGGDFKDGFKNSFLISTSKYAHYNRNYFNEHPRNLEAANAKEYSSMAGIKKLNHTMGPGASDNMKMIKANGWFSSSEAIFSANGNPVLNVVNAASFNYVSPGGIIGNVGHFITDMVPYYVLGNASNDPTNPLERLTGCRVYCSL